MLCVPDALCVQVRTPICVRFFPRLFFAYFVLFHIYFFSFPFGFSYLALISIGTRHTPPLTLALNHRVPLAL